MATLNRELIGDFQSLDLSQRVAKTFTGVDLSYTGYDRHNPKSFERFNKDAHINRVLFWLSSRKGDFVRQPGEGGILYSIVGQLSSNFNTSLWEKVIADAFNTRFSNDLSLVSLNISIDKATRILTIDMVVRDLYDDKLFTVAEEILT